MVTMPRIAPTDELTVRGTPRKLLLSERGATDLDRFARGFVVLPNGCWSWIRAKSEGYGRLGQSVWAHRFAYEFMHGPIASGLTVDHLCRNRACVNPDHMELVTLAENKARGMSPAAIAARQTHCVHGHLFDEANTYYRKDGQGRRMCRTCARERARERARKARR